ncbi:hypothetical protein [Bacillus mojavensis]|uniref:hypothetical protein n=1 Tax=Bacillus mojavensis TaxID=72360 RepID=UPI002DB85941|nr:hypothetical protein [Bacillus mojavensis]MEC1288824.1 hypothetical protein [Bacillus mojavensis]MEC1620601.1 hypothetical protein [Bacillus mojavensis]MEC1634527.1 hypothetical protein [Bacillus mojavensis]MEC1658305.1 hypothetical protein [Bacillus mojavensis]MEC1683929.1 hypothetical protein [Bacillus mojavensis]
MTSLFSESETEVVSTTYMFLTHDEMKGKAGSLNKPINDILSLTKKFESALKEEIKGQKGMIVKKIKEELESKSEKQKTALQMIKEEHTAKVDRFKMIIEDLRQQDVTLTYRKKKPEKDL